MLQFKNCKDRKACTDWGDRCKGCDRSHEEIAALGQLSNALTEHLLDYPYENREEFFAWLEKKVGKKLKARQST